MSDTDTTTDGSSSTPDGSTTSPSGTTSPADGFRPITSQEELDARIGPRLERERGKYADYDDLKAKAARLDEIEESQKDDLTRANDRATAAEAEAAKVPEKVSDALKTHLKSLHEISDEDAELFLTATDPDVLLKQVDRLLGRAEDALKGGNRVRREGQNPPAVGGDAKREFLRGLTAP